MEFPLFININPEDNMGRTPPRLVNLVEVLTISPAEEVKPGSMVVIPENIRTIIKLRHGSGEVWTETPTTIIESRIKEVMRRAVRGY